MAYPDAWLEKCYITITEYGSGGTKHHFRAFTKDIRIRYGEKDIEGEAVLSGGRVVKFTPQRDIEISMSVYGLKGVNDPAGVSLFAGASDTSEPIEITNTLTRTKCRVAILWTTETGLTDGADSAVSTGNPARRVVITNCYVTGYEEEFSTDDALKATITIKAPAFDRDGNGTVTWQSDDGTNGLTALGDYE